MSITLTDLQFSQLVDLLNSPLDYKHIAIKLAKGDAELFIQLAVAPNRDVSEIIAFMQSNNKVAAIKRFREIAGCGLKEAKDAIDAVLDGVTYTNLYDVRAVDLYRQLKAAWR